MATIRIWPIVLIAVAILTLLSLLPLIRPNNNNYQVLVSFSSSKASSMSGPGIGGPSSVYVIGPPQFLAALSHVSGISPIAIGPNETSSIPEYSVVTVNWDWLIRQHVNATELLARLFKSHDLVIAYTANNTYIVAYELARAWAMAHSIRFVIVPGIIRGSGYVAEFGNAKNLIYTSFKTPEGILGAIARYMQMEQTWQMEKLAQKNPQEASLSLTKIMLQDSNSIGTNDPCYIYETQYKSNGITFDYIPTYGGVQYEAYSDGNGTFYYDACIYVVNDIVLPGTDYPFYGINPAVWIVYVPSSTMVNDGGYINYYIGTIDHDIGWEYYKQGVTNSYTEYLSGANPSSSSSYVQTFTVTFGLTGIEISYQVTYSESPSSVEISEENTAQTTLLSAFNNTWTFTFYPLIQANKQYPAAYTEDSAEWVLPQGVNASQTAILYNEFGVNVVTSVQSPLNECTGNIMATYEYVWVDVNWVLYYNPGQTPNYFASPQPALYSDPYITGIASWNETYPSVC